VERACCRWISTSRRAFSCRSWCDKVRRLLFFSFFSSFFPLNILDFVWIDAQPVAGPRSRPIGFRFFAVSGKILAGHVSQVDKNTDEFGLSYVTIRHSEVEWRSASFVRALNFTGFGALWWWIDIKHTAYLIDFNARAERHQCLVSVVGSEHEKLDPCFVFQRWLAEERQSGSAVAGGDSPLMVPAGFRYTDPVRALRTFKREYYKMLIDKNIRWNLQRDDAPLEAAVQGVFAERMKEMGISISNADGADSSSSSPPSVKNGAAELEEGGAGGWTPLLSACKAGSLSVVAYLLEKGASLTSDEDGTTCLHLAAESGNIELVRMLVEKHGMALEARRDSFKGLKELRSWLERERGQK
jgi:hypothetical protein